MKRIILSLFLTGMICFNVMAQEEILLNGIWQFSKGDKKEWANPKFNKRNWELTTVPAWDWAQGYTGYGWYSKDVELSKKETYFLNLGQVDDDCEVYFNGHLLDLYTHPTSSAKADTAPLSRWKIYRSYYLPKEYVKPGKKNNISVRVWNTGGGQGGIRYGKIYVSNTVFYNRLPIELAGNWIKKGINNYWAASFYDDKAVYKNLVWNYDTIDGKDGSYTITLKNNDQRVQLLVKKVNDTEYLIGENNNDLIHCSIFNISTDNATAKTNREYKKVSNTKGTAIYSGYIRNFSNSHLYGNEAVLEIIDGALPYPKNISINSDGTFSLPVDIQGPKNAILRLAGLMQPISVYLSPGQTTFQLIDMAEFKIYITSEFYNRQRLTMNMGELAQENNLLLYMDWLQYLPDGNIDIWKQFLHTASVLELKESTTDEQMNIVASFIVQNYQKYKDTEALQKAKIWSAKTLLTSPDNHVYNNTLNIILQNTGEKLEGLEYLVKALELAQEKRDIIHINNYKTDIKRYIANIIKE